MSGFVVHSIPGSPYGRAVLAALEEKGARYRFAPVAPGMLREDAHRQRHPFGKVPVLEHGDYVLYETQAILRYLYRVLPKPALSPQDPATLGRMDQLLNICDCYLMQGVGTVIGFHRVVAPRLLGLVPDEAAIAAAMPKAHIVFAELAHRLGDKPYLVAETMTLADLLVAPHLDFLAQAPEWHALTASRPTLTCWLDRMRRRASFEVTTWERVSALAAAS